MPSTFEEIKIQLKNKIMKTLFVEGGVLFMGMLSIVLLAILVLAVKNIVQVAKNEKEASVFSSEVGYIKSLGLFALVMGFLGQFIGLFSAFEYIAQQGTVSPSILAAGFKVSSIASIYGMVIFLIAYLIWFGLKAVAGKK